MKIKSKYETYKIKEGFKFSEPSKAIQSLKNSTLIDSYLRKYNVTGVLGDPSRASMARFGDFASLPDFQESANRVAKTTQFFEQLPSTLRKRFGNNVSEFVAFISNPANIAEAQKLGLSFFDSKGDPVNAVSDDKVAPSDVTPSASVTPEGKPKEA